MAEHGGGGEAVTEAPGATARAGRGPWRWLLLVLALAGLGLSLELLHLHVKVHLDPEYRSFCAVSEAVNCETVAESAYSVFWGLPVALWGALGYIAAALLAAWGLRRRRQQEGWPAGFLFGAALAFSLVGIGLWILSAYVIASLCLLCMGTYAVNLLMLAAATAEARRLRTWPHRLLARDLVALGRRPRLLAAATVVGAGLLAVLWAEYPAYWEAAAAELGPGGLAVGQTADGQPWIGADAPRVVVEEFSDYQCPHCRRGHREVRALVDAHPETLRLVHRHLPLDHHCNPSVHRRFHPWSCLYAFLGHCAGEQGRFWPANDYLFEHGRRREPISAQELARGAGLDARALSRCLSAPSTAAAVARDIAAAKALGIHGTPTFVVDGRTYPGRLPPAVVEGSLGEEPVSPETAEGGGR